MSDFLSTAGPLIVDLLNTIIWPITVSFLAICFRTEIRTSLKRIVRFGKEGVEFAAPSQQTRGIDATAKDQADPLKPSNKVVHYAPTLQPLVEDIEENFRGRLPEAKLHSGLDTESHLLRIASEYWGALHLERAYRSIFGSQIRALEFLSNSKDRKANKEALRVFYNTAREQNREAYENYSFEQWLEFLLSSGLVEIEDDRIRLTNFGLAFPTYITQQNYVRDKPL